MGKTIVVYPYKMGSASGKLLAETLDVYRVYPDRDYRPNKDSVVINWGNGETPRWDGKGFVFLNRPEAVMNAINKIRAFRAFRKAKVPIPNYTLDRDTAEQWVESGKWVVCRTQVEGEDGSGLVLAKTPDEMVNASLYTQYVPVIDEFRAYVFRGELLVVYDRRRKTGTKTDPYIRTGGNNWVLSWQDVKFPKDLPAVAAEAVAALGLDFGGVDVIQSKEDGKCRVLEVNTAPDIRETTVTKFVDAIQRFTSQL